MRFEPPYEGLRTIGKLFKNFSIQNVLKFSTNLRLGVLINFVLIKKRVYDRRATMRQRTAAYL